MTTADFVPTTEAVDKATSLLALLKQFGIVPADADINILTHKALNGDLWDQICDTLTKAQQVVAECKEMQRTANRLYSDLHFTKDHMITDLTGIPADKFSLVEEYNSLVARGMAETMTPAERDRLMDLSELLDV